MMDIDKWTAEKLGVTVSDHGSYLVIGQNSAIKVFGTCFWDMEDARCRELVRERLGMSTNYFRQADDYSSTCSIGHYGYGEGKTIEEAEINCLKAMMEEELANER